MLRVSTAVTSGKAWPSNAFQGILSGGDPAIILGCLAVWTLQDLSKLLPIIHTELSSSHSYQSQLPPQICYCVPCTVFSLASGCRLHGVIY